MTNYLEADRKLRRAREALAVRTTVNADQAESISTYEHTQVLSRNALVRRHR
jgi:hypothetical protein